MMPTSPRSPLSFRTAGFPQYGWKAGSPSGTFPDHQRLKPAPRVRRQMFGFHPPLLHLLLLFCPIDTKGHFIVTNIFAKSLWGITPPSEITTRAGRTEGNNSSRSKTLRVLPDSLRQANLHTVTDSGYENTRAPDSCNSNTRF